MTLRTTGEGGAVAVGVSATREAERASDRDGLSLAMNCAIYMSKLITFNTAWTANAIYL